MWDYGDSCLQCMDSQPLEGNLIEECIQCVISLWTPASQTVKYKILLFKLPGVALSHRSPWLRFFWKMYLALEFAIFKRCEQIYTSLDIIFPKKEIVHKDGVTHPGSHG